MHTSWEIHKASGPLAVKPFVDLIHNLDLCLRNLGSRLSDSNCKAALAAWRWSANLGRSPSAGRRHENVEAEVTRRWRNDSMRKRCAGRQRRRHQLLPTILGGWRCRCSLEPVCVNIMHPSSLLQQTRGRTHFIVTFLLTVMPCSKSCEKTDPKS